MFFSGSLALDLSAEMSEISSGGSTKDLLKEYHRLAADALLGDG